jgi:predicted transcriptional regulator of viral defense system
MESKQGLLDRLIEEHGGLIFTKYITDAGISRDYLSQKERSGCLKRIGRGAYLAEGCYDDAMYRLQFKHGRAVFSHDTALFLHDLSDLEPIVPSVTVPSGYNARRLKEFPASVFFVSGELYPLGMTEHVTAFGNSIICYSAERAICDVLRSRSKTDIAVITGAIKRYSAGRNKNIPKLMKYAEKFRVTKLIRPYLEVLL